MNLYYRARLEVPGEMRVENTVFWFVKQRSSEGALYSACFLRAFLFYPEVSGGVCSETSSRVATTQLPIPPVTKQICSFSGKFRLYM
jgi:hypothetical protein